jgi:hypothetical protein
MFNTWWMPTTGELIPPIDVDPNSVTPGVAGFLITLFVGLSVVLIILDMTRRVRRVRYRSMVNEKLDVEELGNQEPPSSTP